MRIIIIGAVAAGTSAAAKARRNNEDAEIIIYEKDTDISYSGCGIPYFLGGHLHRIDDLTPRNPSFFKSKYNVDIFIHHEVLTIETGYKTNHSQKFGYRFCFYRYLRYAGHRNRRFRQLAAYPRRGFTPCIYAAQYQQHPGPSNHFWIYSTHSPP